MSVDCPHPFVDTRLADEAEAKRYVGKAQHARVELTFCTVCGEVFSITGVGPDRRKQ